MTNPSSDAHTGAQFATRASKLDKGRVTQVKSHDRGDTNAHFCKVKIKGDDVEEVAQIMTPTMGEVNVPDVDDYVIIGYFKGERPLVLGSYYPIDVDSGEITGSLKEYDRGERVVGHSRTDAAVLIDTNGDILSINADGMSGETNIRDHDGNYIHQKGSDIFVHPSDDGGVYGVGNAHQGVLQAPDSEPTTEYVNVGVQPQRIDFDAQLHQMRFNEPYYTADDTGGDRNESMAVSEGTMTLSPLSVASDVNVNGSLDPTSETNPRVEHEPHTAEQLDNPTQVVKSQAWWANSGTDYRSYHGDGQVIRLIQGSDASMTEQGRVEARVNYVDDTGFELEWFMNNETNATWLNSTDVNPTISYTAYE